MGHVGQPYIEELPLGAIKLLDHAVGYPLWLYPPSDYVAGLSCRLLEEQRASNATNPSCLRMVAYTPTTSDAFCKLFFGDPLAGIVPCCLLTRFTWFVARSTIRQAYAWSS